MGFNSAFKGLSEPLSFNKHIPVISTQKRSRGENKLKTNKLFGYIVDI
jgi:hypothetical protein